MKNRFTTLDIVYLIHELRQKLVGLRVDQVYDIDKKTYLIRLVKSGVKEMLLLESGTRFHTTQFDWPKNPAPSGFSMKLRKHLNNKRLEKIEIVGADRILHLQFGVDQAAYHLFLELYDKGNLILTDYTLTILYLVRPRIVGQERMAAHEKYALDKAKQCFALERYQVEEILRSNPTGSLRDVFLSKIEFGPTLFSHVLSFVGLTPQVKIGPLVDTEENILSTLEKIMIALEKGVQILTNITDTSGIIVLAKQADKSKEDDILRLQNKTGQPILFYDQFHPSVLASCFDDSSLKFESFDEAIDDFFSKVESQKLDMKQLNQEKEALKKIEYVKQDQQKRLKELQQGQSIDKLKAELIIHHQKSVDMCIITIRKLVASQISWGTIEEQIQEARSIGDPLATMISKLNLKQNNISVKLSNPYDEEQEPMNIDIDLDLSAFANASKYFVLKKASAKKEERTIESQGKALKSTEKKTMQSLKEAATIHSIKKARKVLWFEKFRWFITSENYLVIGGRDAQQNELLVKRYLRPRDIYMHADAHGAPTLIIKNDNPTEEVPPKTLNETGVFAVSCSGSWESKVVPSSWWVWGDQVSKSAPTGEYLPTGSFMIRGKKNYLPPYQLVLGFGFLFRLAEDSVEAHKNERARKGLEFQEVISKTENSNITSTTTTSAIMELGEDEEFPDTQVSVKLGGDKIRSISTGENKEDEEAEFFVTTSLSTNINQSIQKLKNKQKKSAKNAKNQPDNKTSKREKQSSISESVDQDSMSTTSGNAKAKRGQHGRKKKLKEKYKDQTEEERELRMKLLQAGQSAVLNNDEKGSNDIAKSEVSSDNNDDTVDQKVNELESESTNQNIEETEQNNDDDAEEKEDATATKNDNPSESIPQEEEEEESREGETELDLLKTLTGYPLESDELLYAVPVCAPYSTLQNYKFRIKMTPGNTKRGKAAKTALESFLRDKDASNREKDLIKAIKDQDLARNIPGKVKLSNIIRDKK